MKSIYILCTTIIFSVTVYSQWTNQNPVPDGNHLWSTIFVDDNTGWMVGSSGFIKKTTNAGLDWVQQNSGTTLTLRSVQFIDQNTGWICGEAGLIIKTLDGGQNWFELTSGTTNDLTDLQFCDTNIGYMVGFNETILKTTNGGTSWTTQNSGSTYDLLSVDFVDALLGYAVGGRDSTKCLKTIDGGLNWISKSLIINTWPPTEILNCVEFFDPYVGFVGTGTTEPGGNAFGSIYKTTDGGETWSSTLTNAIFKKDTTTHIIPEDIALLDTRYGIHSIYFKDSNNGYAVGGSIDGWRRGIYSTTNAGATWQTKYFGWEQTGLLSVFVNSLGQGWAVGFKGVIYTTEDNGSSWSQILSGSISTYTGDRIMTVFMINDTVGWAGGSRNGEGAYYLIMKTTNGGKIWKTNFQGQSYYQYKSFTNIYFKDENYGWAASDAFNGGFYKTTDGGENWSNSGIYFNYMFFISQDLGWLTQESIGPYGGIKNTTDGGLTWMQKSSVPSSCVYFTDLNNGWAVGAGGSILKSTDGGETWATKTSGTSVDLNSVRFYNSNVGMCVGTSGTVLLSSDGGENWISQSAGTTANLNSVAITNATTAWIAGSEGTIQNTTDLGSNWISYSGLTGNFTSLHFINENIGWVVNESNNIYKYFVEPVSSITLTKPNGYEAWKTGWTRNITWSKENVQYVNIYYSTNSGTSWNSIVSSVDASSGSYAWEIPVLVPFISPFCKIKIEDASNSSIFDESDNNFIIWHTCNVVKTANLGQQLINFLETNIDISLNVNTSDDITVNYYPYETPAAGTLPSGVVVISDYYWQVTSPGISFNDGKMIVPVSELRGVSDPSKLVWLKRTASGDPWENIGGIISGDNLESTILFNSFSEFAIGSTDPVNPLPVELYSFKASVNNNKVQLIWTTATETNNFGFEVERATSLPDGKAGLTSPLQRWEKIGFVEGQGNSNSPKSYLYTDNSPFGGNKFQYRLKQLDTDGQFEYSNEIEVEIVPNKLVLYQNYPNPFNPTTKIRYSIPSIGTQYTVSVQLKIYDILGNEVATLVNEKKEPGTYEVELNAQSLSSGTYIYRIVAGDPSASSPKGQAGQSFVETKKMMFLK